MRYNRSGPCSYHVSINNVRQSFVCTSVSLSSGELQVHYKLMMSYDLMSLPVTLLFVATGQSLFPEGQIESQQNLAIKFQNSSPYYSFTC